MALARRLRGLAGVAAVWGGAFAVVGAAVALLMALVVVAGPFHLPGGAGALAGAVAAAIARWAAMGVLSGAVFALLVTFAERRRTLETLSPGRLAWWGAIAGAVGATAVVLVVLAMAAHQYGVVLPHGVLRPVTIVPLVGAVLGRVMARAVLRGARRGAGAPDVDAVPERPVAGAPA